MPLVREPLAEKLDVPARQVQPRYPVAAVREADQVRAGAARDVDHRAHAPAGEALEAVDEEVDFALAVHVEGDLVQARSAVFARASFVGARDAGLHRTSPHHASSASRMTHEAAMPVRPDGSHACATSTRSPPMTRQSRSRRTM